MVLVASCAALYFPDPPMNNVLTLTWHWKDTEAPPLPYGSVIFKVKSSAPHLFHVLPRYGALLVSDASGNPCGANSTQVVFGLRTSSSNYFGAGAADVLSDAAPTTIRRSTPSIETSKNYQERFAIEHLFLASNRTAYDRLAAVLATDGRLTEVVRSIWILVMSGTLQAVRGTPISLKVFTEGVTLDEKKAGDSVIVPPPTAQLIPPFLERQAMSRAFLASAQEVVGPTEHGGLEYGKRSADELRSLKLRINAPHYNSSAKLVHSTSLGGAISNPVAAPALVDRMDGNLTREDISAEEAPVDITMSMYDVEGAASSRAKAGIPLFIVLAAMFGTYAISTLLWHGSTGNRKL